MWRGEDASPPVITSRTPPSNRGYSSATALNRLVDRKTVVMPCASTSSASTAGSGVEPGYSTPVPPCSSAPHSSTAKASQDIGAAWSQVRCPVKSRNSWPKKSRTRARCGRSTPLGRPVEPEVNITQAMSSGAARPGRPSPPYAVAGPSSSPSGSSRTTVAPGAAALSAVDGPATTTRTRAWRAISASRRSGKAGSISAYPAPHLSAASSPVTSSGPRSRQTPTSVPGPAPSSASRRASRSARASSAP